MTITPTIAGRSIAAIIVIGLAVRFGVLARNWNNLDFLASFSLHGEVARNALEGRFFQKDSSYLQHYLRDCIASERLIDFEDYPSPAVNAATPLYNDEGGYGLFVAATWKIAGAKRWWYVRVIQILMDMLLCWMMYRIGTRLFTEGAGLLSAALYAVFIPGIEIAVRPHRDFWVTALFVVTVYVLTTKGGRREGVREAVVGAASAVVAAMRSTAVAFAAFLALALFALQPSWKTVRNVVVLAAAFALFFSPILVRNYAVFGKLMATRGAFWHSFWGGVGQMPNPCGVREDDQDIMRFATTLDPAAVWETERYEQALKEGAEKLIADHPVWYMTSVVRRAIVIVYPRAGRAAFFQPPAQEHQVGFVNRVMGGGMSVAVDLVIGTLFLSALWMFRRQWRSWFILLIPFVYTLITLAPFYVTGRNIANVYFVVLLFASAAAVSLTNRWTGKRTAPAEAGAGPT